MNIDPYFFREYNENTYNCAHFVCEVWEQYTGEDIRWKLLPLLDTRDKRHAVANLRHNFDKLQTPEEPCIVLAHRRRCGPHVGMFISNKVFHISDVRVELVPLEVFKIGFDGVGYYK